MTAGTAGSNPLGGKGMGAVDVLSPPLPVEVPAEPPAPPPEGRVTTKVVPPIGPAPPDPPPTAPGLPLQAPASRAHAPTISGARIKVEMERALDFDMSSLPWGDGLSVEAYGKSDTWAMAANFALRLAVRGKPWTHNGFSPAIPPAQAQRK